MKLLKINVVFFMGVLVSIATASKESENILEVLTSKPSLVCISDCTTAVGENNEACYPNEIVEYNLKSSKINQDRLITGGWDGDQLDEVSFQISDLQNLYAGLQQEIFGIERKGYNYGADYISTWQVKCSLKM
jgi:hypothetical protein